MKNQEYHSIIKRCRIKGLHCLFYLFLLHVSFSILSCDKQHEHIAPAVDDKDSLPFMRSHGISNLISDSGIISYKIVAEDWNIYTTPRSEWTFPKGLFLEKFDSTFHVEWHVQADTAFCHSNRIWELRGRVVILNREGTLFRSEELFWDMDAHQMWSNLFMRIDKPDTEQQLQGNRFRSNEEMTDYHITYSSGVTPVNEEDSQQDTSSEAAGFGATDNGPSSPTPRASTADSRRHQR